MIQSRLSPTMPAAAAHRSVPRAELTANPTPRPKTNTTTVSANSSTCATILVILAIVPATVPRTRGGTDHRVHGLSRAYVHADGDSSWTGVRCLPCIQQIPIVDLGCADQTWARGAGQSHPSLSVETPASARCRSLATGRRRGRPVRDAGSPPPACTYRWTSGPAP